MSSTPVPAGYGQLLTTLKAEVRAAQLRAHRVVNTELLTLEHGWSRHVLLNQIMNRLHERSGAAPSNFTAGCLRPVPSSRSS